MESDTTTASDDNSTDDLLDTDEYTDSTDTRWVGLGTVIASFLVVSFVLILVTFSVYSLFGIVPALWEYIFFVTVLTSVGWIFGEDLVKIIKNR